jgi:hypothetical protein
MLKTKRPLIYLSGLLPFFLNQKSYTADQTAEVGLAANAVVSGANAVALSGVRLVQISG